MLAFITDIFNTREIAIGIIVSLLIFYVLIKSTKEIRESFHGLIKAFFHKKIITPIAFMFIYSLGVVYMLNTIGLWENHQIKNFIYWLVVVGILTHFKKDTYDVKTVIKETLSLIVIFQFILNFYTFNIFLELVLIFLTIILSVVKVVSEKQENKEIINKFVDTVFVIFGLIIIGLSINQYISNFDEFANSKTMYDFFVPTILSVMIIPYFYLFFMVVRYENGFIALNYALKDDLKLLRYAKFKGILAFNFDGKSFEKWCQNLFTYNSDKESIKQSIEDIKKLNKVQKSMDDVNIQKGWNISLASIFLKEFDIKITDYRRIYGGRWSGSSNYISLHEENSHIFYKIEGNLEYVDKLEIQLFFYIKDKINIEKSYNLFVNICNEVSIKSINHQLSKKIINSLISNDDLSIDYHEKKVLVVHQSFDTGAYKLIFTIF